MRCCDAWMLWAMTAATLWCAAASGTIPDEVDCVQRTLVVDVTRYRAALQACDGTNEGECCSLIEPFYAEGGTLGNCMCSEGYYTSLLDLIPRTDTIMTAEEFIDRISACDILIQGRNGCTGDGAPLVRSQTLTLAAKALLIGGILGRLFNRDSEPAVPVLPTLFQSISPPSSVQTAPVVVAQSVPSPVIVLRPVTSSTPAIAVQSTPTIPVQPTPTIAVQSTPTIAVQSTPPIAVQSTPTVAVQTVAATPPPAARIGVQSFKRTANRRTLGSVTLHSPGDSGDLRPDNASGGGGSVIASQSVVDPADGCQTVWAGIEAEPNLSLLKEAAQAAGFRNVLDDRNLQATVFLPVNSAFSTLIKNLGVTKDALLSERKTLLMQILQLHIVPGPPILIDDLTSARAPLETLTTESLGVTEASTTVGVAIVPPVGRPANVLVGDLATCAAAVHLVDSVLLPTAAATVGLR